MYRLPIIILSFLFLSSCQKDTIFSNSQPTDEINPSLNLDIPEELVSHFIEFKDLAEKNGYIIDYEKANITAEMRFINEGSVAGTCSTNGHNLRHITIDQKFWNRAPHLLREMIVFHELGHCILGRGHTEDSFQNGICTSIMRSGVGSCRDAYTSNNRDYFIEELFSEVDVMVP